MAKTTELPHALEDFAALMARLPDAGLGSGEVLLGLDFDGTLAPIAPRPEDAVLPEGARGAVERLVAHGVAVAVISGRGLEDVRDKVGVDGVVYAGSHGFEIAGGGLDYLHPVTAEMEALLPRVADEIEAGLAGVDGVQVERKRVSLAVHERRVGGDEGRARVAKVTRDVATRYGLRCKTGKEVFELGPDVDWHKGRALQEIAGGRVAMYVGDDVTDEDAFATIGEGVAIVVTRQTRQTAAEWRLDDPTEVVGLLERLAEG